MSRKTVLKTVGSSDSLAIVEQQASNQHMTLVISANASDARRLVDEVRWLAPDKRVFLFPDWETLPYERFSPHQDLISERLSTLYAIYHRTADIVITALTTLLHRLPPSTFLAGHVFFLEKGQTIDIDRFRQQLSLAGYTAVNHVVAPGEYAVRGGLIDLFPMGERTPFRIDLFDDEIETIRLFDVDSQRTLESIDRIRLLPAREFPTDEAGRTQFRAKFRELFEGDPSKSQLYRDITAGLLPAGIEYYLAMFFDQTETLFDYIDPDSQLILHGDMQKEADPWWSEIESRYRLFKGDQTFPLLPPKDVFLTLDEYHRRIKPFDRTHIESINAVQAYEQPDKNLFALPAPEVGVLRDQPEPLAAFKQFKEDFDGRILLSVDSAGRAETVSFLFSEHQFSPVACNHFEEFLLMSDQPLMITVSPLQAGFITQKYAIITENELYPSTVRVQQRRKTSKQASVDHWIRDLVELKTGEPVVHQDYGIGCYQGLVSKDFGEGLTEFLVLTFAGDDTLYVPVSQLHVISRYHGSEQADLNRLGSPQWEKAKRKAAMQARDTAAELLLHYAQRASQSGFAFELDEQDYQRFCDNFGFEETPDQATAIQAVINDMLSPKPMDRLVCGDVGFGKTEVALRAAFVAIQNGKQVAVLAPTTLLVEQHYQLFCDRFASWPVKIVELSRFRSTKEINQALEAIAEGQADIVIGTHRLLQEDVVFKRLGLVVIDEEHRFGVRQKEKLKMLRTEVDTLRLTATPIPRSLAMSIEGLSDFSIITTAPQKRLSIRTMVAEFSNGIIREACLREIKRGGQIYFLHNKITTIQRMKETLESIIPEAKIEVGHGKMHERDLERVMRDFVHQRFNLLLCTTIIETGIDIPNANTIIIDRADKFGLAQLHQLRGRVGRSHHQAYAYLLTPPDVKLSSQAQKRLDAIRSMEDLGSGFFLAMHDMEIRGAGEVLGEAQSGEIQEVGFQMYQEMLDKAIKSLEKGEQPDLDSPLSVNAEVNLHLPALLPDQYCPDIHERLTLYKRLSDCDVLEELTLLREELIDRFGKLPEQANALIETHRVRLMSQPIGISKIDATDTQIILQFNDKPDVDPYRIIQLIQNNRDYKMNGADKLIVQRKTNNVVERVKAISDILIALTTASQPPSKKGK